MHRQETHMLHTITKEVIQETKIKELNLHLIFAIYQHDDEGVKNAIKDGADIDVSDAVDEDKKPVAPPIHAAINIHNLTALRILLKQGASVATLNARRVPALTRAVVEGSFDMVQEMLLYGADPNTYHGRSVLSSAIVDLPSLAVIKYSTWSTPTLKQKLLDWYEQKGEFSTQNPYIGVPFPPQSVPLRASYQGMQEIVSLLLSKGAHFWIPNDNNITILDFLGDPVKYKTEVIRPDVRFIDSVDKDILTCEVDVNNRNNSAPSIKIIVDYDLREIRKRIHTFSDLTSRHARVDVQMLSNGLNSKISDHIHDQYSQTALQLGTQLQTVQQTLQSENSKMKEELSVVQTKTNFLYQPKVEKFQYSSWLNEPGHENLELFNRIIITKLENIFISFKAVDGDQITPKAGKVAAIKGVVEAVGDAISIAPLVGTACEKLIKWSILKSLQKIDESRQMNTANQAAKLLTLEELIKKEGLILAKKLTIAFAQPLLGLATLEEAKKYINPLKNGLNKVKNILLKDVVIAPAEQEALMLMTWVIELLYESPKIAERVKQEGLAEVLFSEIIEQAPPNNIKQFWQSVTEKFGGVCTKSGQFWHPENMVECTGIRTEKGEYFTHEKSKPETYGWRLVTTIDEIKSLQLKQTLKQVEVPVNPPASALLALKIPHPPRIRTLPFNPLYDDNNNNNNGTHAHSAVNGTVTFSYNQRQQALPSINPDYNTLPSATPFKENEAKSTTSLPQNGTPSIMVAYNRPRRDQSTPPPLSHLASLPPLKPTQQILVTANHK